MPARNHALALLVSATAVLAACGGGGGGDASSGASTDTAVTSTGNPVTPTATPIPGGTPTPTPLPVGTPGATPTPAPLGTGLPATDPTVAGITHRYYKITVTDASNGQPVSGATLTTTAQEVFTSDDNGVIAFYEPGLMATDVWFSIARQGYDVTPDGLGIKGIKLHPVEGGTGAVPLNKTGTPATLNAGDLQTRLTQGNVPQAAQCLAIRVFDKQNNRGVPLVTLTTANGQYLTDSQGMVAYCNPDHMGAQDFTISTYGYTYSGGVAHLNAVGGQIAQLGLDRQNIAERLYRTTGQGIYRDSVLLGLTTPLRYPNLNAQVTGQDSVITALYKGKIFWTWGDTNNSAYALGEFDTSGAVSDLPANSGLSPDLGLNQTYYTSGGFSKKMVADPTQTSTPIWVGALIAVPDAQNTPHLFASYIKNAQTDSNGNVTVPATKGLAQFDDASSTFIPVITSYNTANHNYPDGGEAITFNNIDQQYAYFGSTLRIPANATAMQTPTSYQVFTAYKADGSGTLQQTNGVLNYAWTSGGLVNPVSSANVSGAGLNANQSLSGHVRDTTTGNGMTPTSASITWNAYRHRFVMVSGQQYATGEIWYAEADTPMGPWVDARKIITHPGYTFYNPYVHPYLSPDNGRTMYLEGSYTMTYSAATVPTPFYNYNQIMYRLNVDDPSLVMPVPVYDLASGAPGSFVSKRGLPTGTAAVVASFLAPDRAATGTLAFGFTGSSCVSGQRLALGSAVNTVMFYALPATGTHPSTTVPLYEYANGSGQYAYSINASLALAGYTRNAAPVAWVWSNPVQVKLPVGDYQDGATAATGADACVAAALGLH